MTNTGTELGELSVEQYQTLIEQTSDVITVVNESGTIVYQSSNSEHVKGWPQEELLGENIIEYIHPHDRSRVVKRFSSLTEEEGIIDEEIEFRFRTKDDGYIWLAATGTAPGAESPIDGYVTTSRDITRRKEFEQQLTEQRDTLETLNEVIRHDIRNDLQVIEGHTKLLEEHLEGKAIEGEAIEDLEAIKESTESAITLTRTTGDLTEIMLGPERETQPVSLTRTITDELETVRSTYPEADMTVAGELPETTVLADDLLSSVIRNILNNAVKHNDKGTPEVAVSVTVDGDWVDVRFADNGPGVPDERKKDIFGKGEKGLESTGTGVGLYLVSSLVESYGGEVWVEDNEPEGSVFVIRLAVPE